MTGVARSKPQQIADIVLVVMFGCAIAAPTLKMLLAPERRAVVDTEMRKAAVFPDLLCRRVGPILWPKKQGIVQFPHRFETWLYCGHTVPNGDPAEPYARGVGFTGVVLATPLLVPDEFDVVRAGDREVRFQSVIPLYTDEMDLKLAQGADALFDKLGEAGVSEGLDVGRPSVVSGPAKRRRFGFRRR